jgi:glutathionyl-hydroquinone reductase
VKDISTIATEIGVSKSAVHKRIKKEPLKSKIQPYISVVGNKVLIDVHGETIIKDTFTKSSTTFHEIHDTGHENAENEEQNVREIAESVENADKNEEQVHVFHDKTEKSSTTNNSDNEIIELLKENMAVLQEQLKIKDALNQELITQIKELTSTVKIQAESINHAHKNELAETIIDGSQKFIEGNKPKKQGLFSKIFSRGNK